MFSFITTKLLAYVCGGLLVALVITGGFAGCEHRNANEARADRDAMKSQRDDARSTRDEVVKVNGTQHDTIERQGKALDEWAKLGVTPKDVQDVVDAANRAQLERDKLVAAMKKLKERDDGNVECENLRRVDYQRVCPGHAASLRGYENRLSRSPGAGASSGVRPAPPGSP